VQISMRIDDAPCVSGYYRAHWGMGWKLSSRIVAYAGRDGSVEPYDRRSNHHLSDLVQADRVGDTVVELGGAGGFVGGDLMGLDGLDGVGVLHVGGDAGGE